MAVENKAPDENAIRLKPKLSLLNGCTVVIGSIIGSGIFVSPKGVSQECGSVAVSLLVWVFCGIFSMFGAYCYAELGTIIKRSGGDYAYMMECFGGLVGFLRLWTENIIIRPATIAVVSSTFAKYIIEPIFPECGQPELAIKCLAIVCICCLTMINCASVRWSTRVQDIFTFAKVGALLLIIITGIVLLCLGKIDNFKSGFEGPGTDVGRLSKAVYSGLFAYNGWNYLNMVTEELREPEKNLPRAIFISVGLVTFIYTMTNVAYFTTVNVQEMNAATAVAVAFSKRWYGPMWWITSVFVSLSTFGGVNGILFTSARLFFVGAREGHMPQVLNMIQLRYKTPLPGVLLMAILSVIYVLLPSGIYELMNYVGFATWLSIGLSVVALLVFRRSRPHLHRPIRVMLFFPIVYLLATAWLLLASIIGAPMETAWGCIIIASGIPFYLFGVTWRHRRPLAVKRSIDRFTRLVQMFFLVVPEERNEEENSVPMQEKAVHSAAD